MEVLFLAFFSRLASWQQRWAKFMMRSFFSKPWWSLCSISQEYLITSQHKKISKGNGGRVFSDSATALIQFQNYENRFYTKDTDSLIYVLSNLDPLLRNFYVFNWIMKPLTFRLLIFLVVTWTHIKAKKGRESKNLFWKAKL